MESGRLVYKCRRCGRLNKDVHVPDGIITLSSVIAGIPLPKEWGWCSVSNLSICCCDDKNLGISDLIGFEVYQE